MDSNRDQDSSRNSSFANLDDEKGRQTRRISQLSVKQLQELRKTEISVLNVDGDQGHVESKYENIDYVRSLVGKVQARRGFSAIKRRKESSQGSTSEIPSDVEQEEKQKIQK